MGNAFSWVQQTWEFLVSLFPHLGLMRANHGGVKFCRGGRVREIRAGLYWWWPLVTEVQEIPTRRQTMRLETQTLTTRDEVTLSVSCVVVYEINDVVKALVDTWDVEDTISDVAQMSVVRVVMGRHSVRVREELTEEIPKEIRDNCKRDLRKFGVLVKDAFLSDCAETVSYRIMGGEAPLLPEE